MKQNSQPIKFCKFSGHWLAFVFLFLSILEQFIFTKAILYNLLFFRILALEKLGAVFNQVSWPLQYTPRKFVIHHESNNLIVIETDHNAYTEVTKQQRKQQMAEVCSTLLLKF